LTVQTFSLTLIAMVKQRIRRLLDAYPAIYLACHRRHVRSDETGRYLSEHQASVLDHLDAERFMTLSKLAEHMGVGRSAMSIMISRLERGGYISRARDGHDRRSLALRLTRAGSRIKEQNTILDPELVDEMFSLMRADDIETALAALEALAPYARIVLRRRKRRRDA
jgi:MarR family transcriptional regulator, organic hydroperoxide resistance regulator